MFNSAEAATDSAHEDTARGDTADSTPTRWENARELILYTGGVLLGTALIAITAVTQPYNRNEWQQIGPYDSTDPSVITSGTRQPPLDALLGSLVQHLIGEGQFRQRLLPVLCGVGSLIIMAALLRRLRLGHIGVLALWAMATMPLFVRYSAYIRPYALPTFLIIACCYAASRWLDDGRLRWLAAAGLAAVLLPLARVPEPVVFLGTSMLVLAWTGWRRTLPRKRAWALVGTFLVALVTVGAWMFLTLKRKTSGRVLDTDPMHALDRFGAGVHEIRTYVLPELFAHWFAWWPVVVLFVVLAVVLKDARRTLGGVWFWLPMLAAPVVFFLGYHFFNPYPLDIRHYRMRFAYFFVPPLVILVAAVGHAVARAVAARSWGRSWGRWVGAALIVALLGSQLPTTASVLTENDSPDYGWAGEVLRTQVPDDAEVLYDSPAPFGRWRQPFSGRERYVGSAPHLHAVSSLDRGITRIKGDGPVYLLILDSECAASVVCDFPPEEWSKQVPGYRVANRFDRFTLYEPLEGQHGISGAITALEQLSDAYGPRLAGADVMGLARLLIATGQEERAHARITELCTQLPGPARCFKHAVKERLFPAGDIPAR